MRNVIGNILIGAGVALFGKTMYEYGKYVAKKEEIERLRQLQLDMRDVYIEVLEKKIKEDEEA